MKSPNFDWEIELKVNNTKLILPVSHIVPNLLVVFVKWSGDELF